MDASSYRLGRYEDQDKYYEAGMADFVTKPVARESLEKIMRSAKKRNA